MDSSDLFSILMFLLCVVLSAFFSSSETAYTSLRKNRLKTMEKDGNVKAGKALKLQENYENLLSTILIGNNIVNITASSIATLFFVKHFPIYGAIISTVFTTILLLLFSEITPKLVAKIMPEKIALSFVNILNFVMTIFKPFVWFSTLWQKLISKLVPVEDEITISEDELLEYVDEARTEGSIEHDEHLLVKNAIEFDDVDVDSILVPRVDIVGIDLANDSDKDIEELFDESGYSRLIVYEKTIDKVLGIIHEKDFYRYMRGKRQHNKHLSIESIVSEVIFIPGSLKLSDLLKLMQMEKKHMSVVIDEHGGVEGIVTMEDILEELVGDIWDETDDVELDIQTVVKGKTYIARGRCPLEDLFETLNIDEEEEEEYHSNTVSGFIQETLGKMPEVNDNFIFDNYKFIVKKVEGNRVEEVIVALVEEQ